MTSINSIVVVTVNRALGALARKGFGTGMICHYHTRTTDRVITITNPTELADYGFPSTDPLYYAVDAAFSQSVRPQKLKIGRLANIPTQLLTITVGAVAEGDKVLLTVDGTDILYTVPAAPTSILVATALVAAINAIRVGTCDNAGGTLAVITTTIAAGALVRFQKWSRNLTLKDTSVDAGLAADLAAIAAEDNDWTGFDLVHTGEVNSKLAAAYAEANDKLYLPTFYDTEIRTSATTDVISDLKLLAYKNTHAAYSGQDTSSHWGFALFVWMGAASKPGAETFAHKQLAGILPDTAKTLLAGDRDYIRAKNGNVYYQLYTDRAVTWEGVNTSGVFTDERRFLSWQKYDLTLSLFDAINSQPEKLPFTEVGRQALIAAAKASMDLGVSQGGWDPDRPYVITAQEMSAVSSVDRAARNFPQIVCHAYLAGAIHATTFQLNVHD